jgi:hypothetical protein
LLTSLHEPLNKKCQEYLEPLTENQPRERSTVHERGLRHRNILKRKSRGQNSSSAGTSLVSPRFTGGINQTSNLPMSSLESSRVLPVNIKSGSLSPKRSRPVKRIYDSPPLVGSCRLFSLSVVQVPVTIQQTIFTWIYSLGVGGGEDHHQPPPLNLNHR